MGKIFYIMGKSSSGKDTIYQRLKEEFPQFKIITLYTTRPIREGEKDGREYYFVAEDNLNQFKNKKKIIECRTYETVDGPWSYFTIDDGQFDLKNSNYLMIGTLESYKSMREYFGKELIIPLYIDVEPGIRLERALARERKQKCPRYKELCRRYLADEEDFSKENMQRCNISKYYENNDFEQCINKLKSDIIKEME